MALARRLWVRLTPTSRGVSGGGGSREDGDLRPSSVPPSGLYELLGVPSSATQTQIKTAYYRQSFLYHPDRNAGSEEAASRFTRIHEAYLVLGSVSLRRKYDRGILSRQDLLDARRPSGAAHKAAPAATRQAHAAHPGPTLGRPFAKPIFDFDRFFRAHYGEQLEREQFIRQRRKILEKRKSEAKERWQLDKLQELAIVIFFMSAMVILFGNK